MPTSETPLDRLRQLRDATGAVLPALDMPVTGYEAEFYRVAHDALGPEGCVTKELEYLQSQLDVEVTVGARLVDENETLQSEVDRLHKRQIERDAELDRLKVHVKAAEKENAILLARLVKLSAAARVAERCLRKHASMAADELLAVLNEVPPQ